MEAAVAYAGSRMNRYRKRSASAEGTENQNHEKE